MQNKKLKNPDETYKILQTISIIFTVLFTFGLIICLTLISNSANPAIIFLVIPILCGMVFSITNCYYFNTLRKLYHSIKDDKITDIAALSGLYNHQNFSVRKAIEYLIKHNYIDRNDLTINQQSTSKPTKVLKTNECQNCGAPLNHIQDEYVCKYCDTHYRIE